MTKADPALSYDDDFYAWTQEQAAALRLLPTEVIGNRVDIAHVAEEIEDLGKRDLREVESLLVRLCQHLIKIDQVGLSPVSTHWQAEALTFRFSAARAFSRSMRQNLRIDQIWRQSRSVAARTLVTAAQDLGSPAACPFTLDELLTDDFDLDATLAKLAAARSSPVSRDAPIP